MKTKLLIILALTISFISCKKDEETANTNPMMELPSLSGESNITFNESVEKWDSIKIANGNSYYYQTAYMSWAGYGATTQIKVINGVVTEKVYQSYTYEMDSPTEKNIDSTIVEDQSNLGTSTYGERPITIDEIYTVCNDEYLFVDASTNTKTLIISSEGIIKQCGYTPNGCLDDCFHGISITGFQWIK